MLKISTVRAFYAAQGQLRNNRPRPHGREVKNDDLAAFVAEFP